MKRNNEKKDGKIECLVNFLTNFGSKKEPTAEKKCRGKVRVK